MVATGRRLVVLAAVLAVGAAGAARAGLWDKLKGALPSLGGGESAAGPSADEVARGLREALELGARKAVERASATGGFLANPEIRIPLPGRLQTAGKILRRVGLGGRVDAFEESLNRAAERAAAEAAPIFSEAIAGLTFDDVQRIWKGGERAATDYLETSTRERLYERFRPVVGEATREVGVTQAYQGVVGRPEVASFVSGTDLDLDHYVTDRALDGLFRLLAEEERRIRTDPLARTTDLLRKVFGR
ncbi:MAG: DUF4197 domain-containing protein [Deferrisomatales bacterium]